MNEIKIGFCIMSLFIIFCVFMMIISICQGGLYCEYCLVAQDRSPKSVEYHPCPKSKSGKHHVIWYWGKPDGGYNYHDYLNRHLE